jgi:hypothetical protein
MRLGLCYVRAPNFCKQAMVRRLGGDRRGEQMESVGQKSVHVGTLNGGQGARTNV